MANLISWPVGNAAYPGPTSITTELGRVHAEDVRDMVFDRSADKTAHMSIMREGESLFTKVFDHLCDKLEPITDPTTLTRAEGSAGAGVYASGGASDWSRTVGSALGEGRGITFTKRLRFQQYVQNFREDVEVHNVNDYLRAFGVAREYAYQVAKKAKRLAIGYSKRWFEDVFCVTSSSDGTYDHVGIGNADPTRMRPLIELLFVACESGQFNYLANVFRAEDMARVGNGQVTIGLTTTGKVSTNEPTIQARVNEDIFTKFAELMSGNGDDPDAMFDMLWTSSAPWGHVGGLGSVTSPSGQLGALTLMQDASLERIKRAVRVVESNFGPAAVGRDRWIKQPANTGTATTYTRPASPLNRAAGAPGYLWGVQMDMLEKRYLRPFFHDPLPRQGDSTIGMVLGDSAADLLHPQSAGVVLAINNN